MKNLVALIVTLVSVVATMAQTFDVPEGCTQAVVVKPTTGNGCRVYMVCYDGQKWSGDSVEGVTGYGGIAPIGTKREGDGKSPEGVYPLRRGLCAVKDFDTQFPMELYDEDDMWSEDVDSPHYNTLVRNPLPTMKGDRLWQRHDTQYRYIVVVEYNTSPVVRGAGSAIFIHAWRAERKPTAGCIGMAERDVKRIVEWLDPSLNPHIVILSQDDMTEKIENDNIN